MKVPDTFLLIPTPLPPMLMRLIGVTSESRFVSLCYYGNKPLWSDGLHCATFSFHYAWKPFIEHPSILWYLSQSQGIHLGSDDEYPSHCLICDRTAEQLYIAPYQEAQRFLRQQHPPTQPEPLTLTPEQWDELESQLSKTADSDFVRLGIFEGPIFGAFRPSTPAVVNEELNLKWLRSELMERLNQFLPQDFVTLFAQAAGLNEAEALTCLKQSLQ